MNEATMNITGIWVCTSAGSALNVLYSTVATGISAYEPWRGIYFQDSSGDTIPVYKSSLPDLENIPDRSQRIENMLDDLWAQANLPAGTSRRYIFMLPEMYSANNNIHVSWISKNIDINQSDIKYISGKSSLDQVFSELISDSDALKYDEFVLIAADSLVDATYADTVDNNNYSVIPQVITAGEAAVMLTLSYSDISSSTYPKISAVSSHIEPNHGCADTLPVSALEKAIRQCCQYADIDVWSIDSVILSSDGSIQDMMEWSQIERQLWHQTVSDEQELAMAAGETVINTLETTLSLQIIRPYDSLGNTGSATLLLNLAIACARFEYSYPSVRYVVVTADDGNKWRHVILLSCK